MSAIGAIFIRLILDKKIATAKYGKIIMHTHFSLNYFNADCVYESISKEKVKNFSLNYFKADL